MGDSYDHNIGLNFHLQSENTDLIQEANFDVAFKDESTDKQGREVFLTEYEDTSLLSYDSVTTTIKTTVGAAINVTEFVETTAQDFNTKAYVKLEFEDNYDDFKLLDAKTSLKMASAITAEVGFDGNNGYFNTGLEASIEVAGVKITTAAIFKSSGETNVDIVNIPGMGSLYSYSSGQ